MDIKVISVKDEPFEELFVPEANYEVTSGNNESETCCLCPEGKQLQLLLYQHIQDVHPVDSEILK